MMGYNGPGNNVKQVLDIDRAWLCNMSASKMFVFKKAVFIALI